MDTKSIYFEIANQIIQYAIDKYEMKILDYLYLSLTDHISFCVKRVVSDFMSCHQIAHIS